MNIAMKLHRFLSEAKEMTQEKVMQKIKDGYWEAEEDVKKGKHVLIRDTKTNKRMTIYIKEDLLEEKFSVKCGLQGALSINGKSIAKVEKQGNNVFVMIDKSNGDKERITVPGGKGMLASEIAEWLEDYLEKNPKVLKEGILEENSKMPLTVKIGDTIKTDAGTLKVIDISVSSLHIKPITYITYKYDVMLDGKNVKGEEKASIDSFKDHFKK